MADSSTDATRDPRTTSGQALGGGIALQLSELSRRLHADQDPSAMLHRITLAAVREVRGTDWAGISLIDRGGLTTRGATHHVVEQVDRHQYELDEGPCVSSSRNARTVRADDLSVDPRWPRFAAAAVPLGVHAMLSVQLFDDRHKFGALNLYSSSSHSFDETSETVAILLASHAAIAIASQEDVTNLKQALDVRDLVGQAKGILMERYHITDPEAFDLLAASSQNTNTRLTDVAEHLVQQRQLLLPS